MLKLFVFFTVLLTGVTFADSVSTSTDKSVTAATKPLPIMRGVGGDFTAVGDDGKPFVLSRYHGKIVLLFFGYTNCADICPFTLGYLKEVYEKLTPKEQAVVQVVFVTIDPEYDTPEHLQEYIQFFNKNFTAVTGSRAEIDAIVKQYQASYTKTSGEGKVKTKEMRRINQKDVVDKDKDAAYVYGHTVNIYVMDTKGRVRTLEYTGTKQDIFRAKIRQLIEEAGGVEILIKQAKTNNVAPIAEIKKTQTVSKVAKSTGSKEAEKNKAPVPTVSKTKPPVPINYWVHLGPPNTRVMAAYGEFFNVTDKNIYLTKVENEDFDHVELHESIIEGNVGKMVEHKEFLIPPNGGSLTFAVGKRHIMLVTPLKPFNNRDETTMILHYRVEGSDEKLVQKLVFPVTFSGIACDVPTPQ